MRLEPLNRRTFLRGLGGVTVGLPILEAMLDAHGEAYAGGAPIEPVFMIYSWGSGVGNFDDLFDNWTPTGVGADWTLSPELAALAPHKPYVTALSNLRPYVTGGHHELRATVFSGQMRVDPAYDANGAYESIGSDRASIDQYIADRLVEQGDDSPFASLVLSLSSVGLHYGGAGRGLSFSWGAGYQLLSPETSPLALYQLLFAGFSPDPSLGGLSAQSEVELHALDAVLASANRLRSRVSAFDRARIDAHLEALYETEHAIEQLAGITCEVPLEPTGDYPPNDAFVEPLVEKNAAFAKLIAQALSCGLTRSIHYMFGGMQADTVIADVGATDGMHLLSHNDLTGTQVSQPEMIDKVATYVIDRLADVLNEMAAVTVADGNLLDHACIMVASEMMDGRYHGAEPGTPLLLIGKAGGRLRTDYHYQPDLDAPSTVRNTANVLLTAMQAMGIDETTIDGGLAESPGGPIEELLL
jgi:Protein of unknown function (DUF1552)